MMAIDYDGTPPFAMMGPRPKPVRDSRAQQGEPYYSL